MTMFFRQLSCCIACLASATIQTPIVTAQTAPGLTLENMGLTALQHLRDDDINRALQVLGTAADIVMPPDNRFDDSLSGAAGGLFRALAQLRSDEQYELLHEWSMPTDDRNTVRIFTSLVPEIAPPREFARALGSRPKKDSFAIASVGKMPGLFCSAWTMVTAADDDGSLRKLITELEELADNNVPNASFALTLARIRDSRSDEKSLMAFLEQRIRAEGTVPNPAERSDAVLVAAAMERDGLGAVAEKLVARLNEFDLSNGTSAFVPFLRRLRAHVILHNRSPETDARDLFYTTPSLWISADHQVRTAGSTGSDEAIWLTHEEHVKRLAGPGDDTLLMRYPLTGTFELKGEVAELEHGGGGLTYGGMAFDANSRTFTLQEVQRPHSESRVWPFVAPKEHRMFNRVNIRCTDDRVTFLSNLHPGWNGSPEKCASCPWLGLRGFGHGRIIFRNLELVGEPIIPRDVKLMGNDDLRGWTPAYGQPTPRIVTPFPTVEAQPPVADPVWTIADGVIHGAAAAEPDTDIVDQNHLAYMRPCLDGETVTCEFFYEEGKVTAHPALGRLVFLMEPDGVRLHWLTDNASEWTGLPEDNAIVEALNRRGPRNLPLKSGEWNAVTLQLSDGAVLLSLNGEEIYQRSLEDVTGTHFGIYHDRNACSVKVRNVVLSGDWPEKLSDEQLGNPVAFE